MWVRDGVDFSFGNTITVNDTISHVFQAVYTLTPAIAYPININSTPVDGVVFGGTFAGASPKYGYVTGGQTLTLSAPATFGGRNFVRWTRNGILLSTNRNTTTVVSAGGTYTAEYSLIGTELDIILYAEYGAGYFDPITITFGTATAFSICTLDPLLVVNDQSIGTVGPSTATVLVEPDGTYILIADDGFGNITTASLYVTRSAMPSASVQIVQPSIVGGTGTWSIIAPSATIPYNIPPLGQGGPAGVLYTSAALVAGSYTHTIGPTAIESAVITNLITDGDLTTNPFLLGTPWTKTGVINYATGKLDFIGNGVLTIPVSITSGKYYWIGAWLNSNAGAFELRYNAVTISSPTADEFASGVFIGVGGVNEVQVRMTGGFNGQLFRIVLFEYDITFGATLVNSGANGQIALTVTNGVPGYSFLWTKTGFPSNIYPDSATISSLDAGTYNVTITDSAGNTFSDSYVVTEPAAIVANTTVTNVTCNNADNGSILFAPSGGTGPYTYMVDGAVRANPVTGLVPGNHTYLVIDANGCTVSGTFVITEPTAVAVSLIVTNSTCYSADNGTVAVTASNGTPPYTYSYDGGSYVAGNTKGSLAAGHHTVNVKDANGCIKGSDFTVTEPTDISVIKTVVNPSYSGASDGSIALAISGGTYPIVVTWADGTVFNLSSAGSILYGGLSQGSYTATVVDANSCSKNVSQALVDDPDVPVEPPSDEDIDKMVIPLNCCRADKIYEVFKAYANGHTQLECLAVPAMTLNNKFKLLSKWYTLGQTIGGSKGVFVFTIASFNDRRISISVPGFSTVVYDGDSNINYDSNMTLFISALTMVGYDAEYESDSGYIFIYSPMNSFYNCIIPEVRISTILVPAPVKVTILTGNGFQGACTPCVTSDKFTPNCLDVNDKNKLVQDLRESCESCLCGKYIISDKL